MGKDYSHELIEIAAGLSRQQLELESPPEGHPDLNEVRIWLKNQLAYKLEKDLEGLFQALYRIDLPEEEFKNLLHKSSPADFLDLLTEAVLKRQLKKAEFRLKYRDQ